MKKRETIEPIIYFKKFENKKVITTLINKYRDWDIENI